MSIFIILMILSGCGKKIDRKFSKIRAAGDSFVLKILLISILITSVKYEV